jgi:hypothetical protein
MPIPSAAVSTAGPSAVTCFMANGTNAPSRISHPASSAADASSVGYMAWTGIISPSPRGTEKI